VVLLKSCTVTPVCVQFLLFVSNVYDALFVVNCYMCVLHLGKFLGPEGDLVR